MEKTKKQCDVCGKIFEPKNYWQKYCCKKCGLLAWAKRELKKQNSKQEAKK